MACVRRQEPPAWQFAGGLTFGFCPAKLGGHIGARFTLKDLALVCAAATAFMLACVGPYLWLAPASPGAQVQSVRPVVQRCHTVTAATYNRRVDQLDAITGRKHHRAKRKVCKHTTYKRLGVRVREARRDCLKRARRTSGHKNAGTTGASFYSYRDSGGLTGACGNYLPLFANDYTYAILRSGNVASDCGGPGYWFHRAGVTRHGTQADTGGGGGEADGLPRTFDFWNAKSNPTGRHRPGLAHDLRLTRDGLGRVQYSRTNCWAR